MALDVYYRDTIARQLLSSVVAMLSSAQAHGGGNVEYCRGALDLARAQALAYGVDWSVLKADVQTALASGGDESLALLAV